MIVVLAKRPHGGKTHQRRGIGDDKYNRSRDRQSERQIDGLSQPNGKITATARAARFPSNRKVRNLLQEIAIGASNGFHALNDSMRQDFTTDSATASVIRKTT